MNVPLAVRLSTSKSDRHVTRDVRALRFSSTIPGGYASATITLDRPLAMESPEILLYGTMYVYDGRSGETVWQGRIEDPGRSAGPDGEVWEVTASGPSAHAKDMTRPFVWIDRDLQQWKRGTEDHRTGRTEFLDDGDIWRTVLDNGVNVGNTWEKVIVYKSLGASGQYLAKLTVTSQSGATDSDYETAVYGANTKENQQSWSTSSNAFSGILGNHWTTYTDYQHARIKQRTTVDPAAVSDAAHYCDVSSIVIQSVRKNKSGTVLTSASDYTGTDITANEVVEDLLGSFLPEYDGANASVATNSFAIEQFAFQDGITPSGVFDELMLLHPDHYWAAWEGSPARFEWKAWPSTVQYEASAKDGFDSFSNADIFNVCRVRWQSRKGATRITKSTATVDVLDDAGLSREAFLDLGDEVGSSTMAARVGEKFLEQHASAPNSGTLRVSSAIADFTNGRTVQPWEIIPGGLIRVRDVQPRVDALNATDRDSVTVFRVVATEYDSTSNTCTLSLDTQGNRLERLLARRRVRQRRR